MNTIIDAIDQQNTIGTTVHSSWCVETSPTWEKINMKTRDPFNKVWLNQLNDLRVWGLYHLVNPAEWRQIDAWYRKHKGFSVEHFPKDFKKAQNDLLIGDLTALQRRSQRKLVRFYKTTILDLRHQYYTEEASRTN